MFHNGWSPKENLFFQAKPWKKPRFLPIKYSTQRLQHLASFAPLRLAPWNILSTEALSFHSRHYFTGRVPWNTDSTKIALFARSAIPQGESSFIRSSPHRAKPAKKNIFLFLRTSRPLRLCEKHRLCDSLNLNSTENFI